MEIGFVLKDDEEEKQNYWEKSNWSVHIQQKGDVLRMKI